MKNILKTALGLFAMGSLVMVSCTDVESLDIVQPTTEETYPESYAAYVQALNDYKASDHKIVYAWFDNSAKVPQSAGQHITSVPDSVDVISMMYPESLAEFELSDMEEVRAKGTKVVYTISVPDIEQAWVDQQFANGGDQSTTSAEFNTYLQTELDALFACSDSFDGIIVEFVGQNPDFMTGSALTAYETKQNIVLNAANTWKSANADKILTWQGKPQNLTDKGILASCDYIILDIDDVEDTNRLMLTVQQALTEGVPTGNILIAVSTTPEDSSDTSYGYWGSTRALDEVAEWVSGGYPATDGFTRAGIAIYNVQNDYYSTGGMYTYVKDAINTLNPAPTK